MSKRIAITGWNYGLRKVSMTQLIRVYCNIGLRQAKDYTDMVLDGKTVLLQMPSDKDAQEFIDKLEQIGAVISIVEAKE